MAAENIKQKEALKKQHEAEFSTINMGMQDRIKLDNELGKLVSKEKDSKPSNKKLIGPN